MLPKVVLALSLTLCVFFCSGTSAYAGGGVGDQNTLIYNPNEGREVRELQLSKFDVEPIRQTAEANRTQESGLKRLANWSRSKLKTIIDSLIDQLFHRDYYEAAHAILELNKQSLNRLESLADQHAQFLSDFPMSEVINLVIQKAPVITIHKGEYRNMVKILLLEAAHRQSIPPDAMRIDE